MPLLEGWRTGDHLSPRPEWKSVSLLELFIVVAVVLLGGLGERENGVGQGQWGLRGGPWPVGPGWRDV